MDEIKKNKWKKMGFWPKSGQEWLTLIMLIGVLYLAFAYWRDITALQEIIEACKTAKELCLC